MLENLGGSSSLAASANEECSAKVKEALCYIAPEQTGNFDHITRIDHRTDLYSLGILFWTLVVGCGTLPFDGSVLEILHAVAHKKPLSVIQARKEVPHMLSLIIEKVSSISRYRKPPLTPCSYYPKTRINDIKGITSKYYIFNPSSDVLVAHMDSNAIYIPANTHFLGLSLIVISR